MLISASNSVCTELGLFSKKRFKSWSPEFDAASNSGGLETGLSYIFVATVTRLHDSNLPNAIDLLLEAGDSHAISGLQILVASGACVHKLTSTDQVLHFRFESA